MGETKSAALDGERDQFLALFFGREGRLPPKQDSPDVWIAESTVLASEAR